MPERSRPVMIEVIEEHFEELDLLWELRDEVIFALDWTLADLAELEERVEANLDGLRLAGGHAIRIARPALGGDERGAAVAATFTLMSDELPELAEEVLEALRSARPEVRDGVRAGLRHSRIDAIESSLQSMAREPSDAWGAAAAADVLAFQRRQGPDTIGDLLGHSDPAVVALALDAAARTRIAPDAIVELIEHEEPAVRRAALRAAARSGASHLAERCRELARADPPRLEAVEALGWLGREEDLEAVAEARARPELGGAALRALGAAGRVDCVPDLIEALADPGLALDASEAFVRLTGAEGLEVEGSPSASEDDDLGDDARPLDPERARRWWRSQSERFQRERRYQDGADVTDPLGAAFDRIALRSRRDLYLGARCADPEGTPDLELEARAELQRRG